MPNGFNQMGSIPEGYDSLLNAARQQLVRMPDGSLQLAPQFGGSTSLDAIYGGILPSAPPSVPGPLKTRSVPTYNVDNTGAPIVAQAPGFSAPSMGATRLEQSGSRPALTAGTQPAGTVTMPPGARPAVVDQMMAQVSRPPTTQPGMFGRGQPSIWDPFGTQVAKDTTRLPANDGGEAGFLSTFYPDAAPSSAVTAINNAAPVPMPRVRPIPPAMTPLTALTGGPVDITVRGGNQLPKVPLPRARPNAPAPQSYTIQSGDTLGALAKRFGTTINQLANANGIANPNKIRAGATLNLGFMAPPVPRMPPAALGRGYAQPTPNRSRETFDSVWAEARG